MKTPEYRVKAPVMRPDILHHRISFDDGPWCRGEWRSMLYWEIWAVETKGRELGVCLVYE